MRNNNHHIVIIGAGRIGSALGHVLRAYNVSCWDKVASKCEGMRDIRELLPTADIVFLCIPSWEVRGMLSKYIDLLPKDAIVIAVSKGIEKKSFFTMDKLLAEGLHDQQPFGFLGGPLMAEELLEDKKGFGVLGTTSKQVADTIVTLFKDTHIQVIATQDVVGVVLCAVLKNIYTLSIGIADGMKWGDNAKGWLVTQAFQEMAGIVNELGGETKTVYSLAGIGDFIATGFSRFSNNRKAGEELALSGRCHDCEAGVSVPLLMKRLGEKSSDFPLLMAINDILKSGMKPRIFF